MLNGKYVKVAESGAIEQYICCVDCPDGFVPAPDFGDDPAKLFDNGYMLDGDSWIIVGPRPSNMHILSGDTKQWELNVPLLTASISHKRSGLLKQSDWTQLPDVPIATKEEWATYRQALRDITSQPGYPLEVVWPVAP